MGWLDNWRKLDQTVLDVPQGMADLRNTVIVTENSKRMMLYASILVEQVEKKARVRWSIAEYSAGTEDLEEAREAVAKEIRSNVVILAVDSSLESTVGKEGYKITTSSLEDSVCQVTITAATHRGVLFGVGRLMREMKMDYHISYARPLQSLCTLQQDLYIVSKPKYRMRQHQIAYRPKTNSYDGFTAEMMRKEVLELALFGTNAIEMIPPGVDDAMQSPNFHIPWLQMLNVVSTWCDDLDINVSMWYPAFFKSYVTPEEIRAAEEHWTLIFSSMPRLDVLFVPGGDPGGRPADEFFVVVERQAAFMREKFFPNCQVWVSSQYGLSTSIDLGLTEPWVPQVQEEKWMEMLRTERVQKFLDGVVYGPWSAVPISEFRAQVPAKLPLRNYPDLCHVQTAEMPVNTWDLSFAVTNGRESINPRPREMAAIIEEQAPYTIGCGCYSEGVNDDVNKYVWSFFHWGNDMEGPLAGDKTIDELLHALLFQYASFLMELPRFANQIVEGILTLERNWRGDLYKGSSVLKSQEIFTEIQNNLTPRHRRNWRLNMILFRALHDAFLYTRLCQERAVELAAVNMVLESGCNRDVLVRAKAAMQVPYNEPPISMSSFNSPSTPDPLNIIRLNGAPSITHLYGQLMGLASALYHQIGYQLSIGYGGQHRQRGAYFDLIWAPLGDVVSINRIMGNLISAPDGTVASLTGRDRAIAERFYTSLMEKQGKSDNKILWYASFGDVEANELPGCADPPTRSIPVHRVLPPYRPVDDGEDPIYFTRPLTEYLDASNDEIIRDLHDGLIPRAWRSFIEPIWPRTARFSMHFPLDRLMGKRDLVEAQLSRTVLSIRITYLGKDLNRHGGDWEELNREAMPVRLTANGVMLHDYMESPEITEMREFVVPPSALLRAAEVETLILTFEPLLQHKTTFRYVPIPIAELWVLDKTGASAKL